MAHIWVCPACMGIVFVVNPLLVVDEPYQDDPRFLLLYEAIDIFHTMPVADADSSVRQGV